MKRKNKYVRFLCAGERDGKIVDIQIFRSNMAARVYGKGNHCDGASSVHGIEVSVPGEYEKEDLYEKERTIRWAKRVRCVETGEVFECVSDLQKEIGIGRWALEGKMRKHLPVNGKTYEYIDNPVHGPNAHGTDSSKNHD